MMKIILDCERMKYVNTGLFHYCLNLGKQLSKIIDPASEQLDFFYPASLPKYFDKANYIEQTSLRKFLLPSLSNSNLWHCTYQNSQYIPMRNKQIKVVLSIHDLNFLYQDKSKAKKIKYLRHLQTNIDRSDTIICISEFSKKDVLNHCNVSNKQLHVIYNGSKSLEAPALTGASYKPQKPFLFSLGTINPKKNVHTLLPLVKQNPELELVIAGRPDDGNYLSLIRRLSKELQIENNVRVLHDITEGEKSWYYHNCYAFMMPSLAEGFGLPVIEAMSAGKPVFLSRCTALPEIGKHYAFYFDDFNPEQMHATFNRGMKRYKEQDMEDMLKRYAISYTWEKTAMQYLNIYRNLLRR